MRRPLHQDEYLDGSMSATDYIATLEAEHAQLVGAYELSAVALRGAIRIAAEVAKELEELKRAGEGMGEQAVSGAAAEHGEPERPSPALIGHRGRGHGRPVRGGHDEGRTHGHS